MVRTARALCWLSLAACGGGPPPELLGVVLEEPDGPLLKGDSVTAVVTAQNADGEAVRVTAWLTPELSAQPRPLEERELLLATAGENDSASWSVRLGEEAFAYEGDNQLHYTAALGDAEVESEPVTFTVRPRVLSLSLRYRGPDGLQSLSGGEVIPVGSEVELTLDTADLAGRRSVRFEARVDGNLLETWTVTPEEDQVVSTRSIPTSWLGGGSSSQVVFRATTAGSVVESPTVLATTHGIYDCGFRAADGSELGPGARVGPGNNVFLRARVWGRAGQAANLELWEQDSSEDDFVIRFDANEQNGVLQVAWSTQWIDDGLLDTEDEYYFNVDFAGARCRSGLLVVPQ